MTAAHVFPRCAVLDLGATTLSRKKRAPTHPHVESVRETAKYAAYRTPQWCTARQVGGCLLISDKVQRQLKYKCVYKYKYNIVVYTRMGQVGVLCVQVMGGAGLPLPSLGNYPADLESWATEATSKASLGNILNPWQHRPTHFKKNIRTNTSIPSTIQSK